MKDLSHELCTEALASGSGRGVLIAILDTGLDRNHEAFANAGIEAQLSPELAPFPDCPAEAALDEVGHGTAVASIIHRLAPDARLLPIRVLRAGALRDKHERIRIGARAAIRQGAHLLNCSFGVPATSYTFPIYKSWLDEAFDQGVHVVTASSNTDPDSAEWPSAFRTSLATTFAELPETEWTYQRGSSIPFVAMGHQIKVAMPGGGYTRLTGSSFAAAHLSGLLARLLSIFPSLSPSYAREILVQLAKR